MMCPARRRRLRGGVVAFLAAGAAVLLATAACVSSPDKDRITEIIQPDFATYRDHVDPYLARRCGTLDCRRNICPRTGTVPRLGTCSAGCIWRLPLRHTGMCPRRAKGWMACCLPRPNPLSGAWKHCTRQADFCNSSI